MNNYEKKIMKLITSGKLTAMEGRLYHIHCQHDPWCASNRGGSCNCDVDVTFTLEPKTPEQGIKAIRGNAQ